VQVGQRDVEIWRALASLWRCRCRGLRAEPVGELQSLTWSDAKILLYFDARMPFSELLLSGVRWSLSYLRSTQAGRTLARSLSGASGALRLRFVASI
jgi:hypothetical protein